MKLELEEYRAEAAHLKNQQATIRRLEERNRQLEQQVCSKVARFFALFFYTS
jgi:homeobox protein cut-like